MISHRLGTVLVRLTKKGLVIRPQKDVMNYSIWSSPPKTFDDVNFFTVIRVILLRLAMMDVTLLSMFIFVCVFIGILYIAMIRRVKRIIKGSNPTFKELVAEIKFVRKVMRESCPSLQNDESDMLRKVLQHLFDVYRARRTESIHILFPDDFRIDIVDETKQWKLVTGGQRQEDRIRLQPRVESPI